MVSLLTKVPNISKNTRKKKIANPIIHDFIASLFLFNEVCSSQTLKEKQFNNLTNLLNERFCRHKDYFINDNVFMSNYEFVKKVVDYLSGKCIQYNEGQKREFYVEQRWRCPTFFTF